MTDFRTPLPIYRAAFARIAPGLGLPAQGKEELRTAYQAADRSGDTRRLYRDVGQAVGGYVWTWPWMEACALELEKEGVWPFLWSWNRINRPFDWSMITHNARVDVLVATLASAVSTERFLANHRMLTIVTYETGLATSDERCTASTACQMRFADAVARGDFRNAPPYFPGDTTYLRHGKIVK